MKNRRVWIVLALAIILFLVISWFNNIDSLSDYNGYSFESWSRSQYYIIIDKKADTTAMWPDGSMAKYECRIIKYFNPDGSTEEPCISEGMPVIQSYVDDVQFDGRYILIDQKPIDSICEFNDSCVRLKYKDWDHLPQIEIENKALRDSKIHVYWIIEKNKDYIYGPYDKDAYLLKKRELGVNNHLKLKFEKN